MSQTEKETEIDLIKFFNYLGKALANLLKPVKWLFVGIGKILLDFAITITRNFKWIVVSALVVGVAGVSFHYLGKKQYASRLILNPKYGSVFSVYETIDYLNDLAENQDSTSLAKSLGVSVHEAAELKSFEIEPIYDNVSKFTVVNDLLQSLDSNAVKVFKPEEVLDDISLTSFPIHMITVKSYDYELFEKLNTSIIELATSPGVFDDRRKTNLQVLNYKINQLVRERQKLDTLQQVVTQEVMGKYEFANQQATTMINVGSNDESSARADDLVKLAINLDKDYANLNKEAQKGRTIIDVISPFRNQSKDVRFSLPVFAAMAALSGALLFIIIVYLRRLSVGLNKMATQSH